MSINKELSLEDEEMIALLNVIAQGGSAKGITAGSYDFLDAMIRTDSADVLFHIVVSIEKGGPFLGASYDHATIIVHDKNDEIELGHGSYSRGADKEEYEKVNILLERIWAKHKKFLEKRKEEIEAHHNEYPNIRKAHLDKARVLVSQNRPEIVH